MTFADWIHNLRLPISIIAGPIIWALELMIGYILVPVMCQSHSNIIILVLGVITGLLTLAMGFVAYRGWRRFSNGSNHSEITDLSEPESLGEFFGSAGAIINSLFLFLIAATAIYGFFLSPCPAITMPFP